MIRRVVGSTAVAVALALSVPTTGSAQVVTQGSRVQRLEHKVAWQAQHIRQLKQRRAYLHRYIKHLRAMQSSGSSGGSSGPLHISKGQAASAMRAAGFSESVIAWFNNGIISRESGYCPTAVYPGHCGNVSLFRAGGPACSLFQLFRCPGPQVADPYVAARYAYAKFQHQGYSAWGG